MARVYAEENILKSDTLPDFVLKHKNVIYHLRNNKVKCCDCKNYPSYSMPQNQVLYKENQFDKLCTEKYNHSHVIRNGNKVHQHCMCAIEVVSNSYLDDLDVTIIHSLLINYVSLPHNEEQWLKEMICIRTSVSHAKSTTSYDISDLISLWTRLEAAVLG